MADSKGALARLRAILAETNVTEIEFKNRLVTSGRVHEKTLNKWFNGDFDNAHDSKKSDIARFFSIRDDIFDVPDMEFAALMGNRFGEGRPGLFVQHDRQRDDFVGEYVMLRLAWSSYKSRGQEDKYRYPWLIRSRLNIFSFGQELRFVCVEPKNPFQGAVQLSRNNIHCYSRVDEGGFLNTLIFAKNKRRETTSKIPCYLGAIMGTVPADRMAIATGVVAIFDLKTYINFHSTQNLPGTPTRAERVGYIDEDELINLDQSDQRFDLNDELDLRGFFLNRDSLPKEAPKDSLLTRSSIIHDVI